MHQAVLRINAGTPAINIDRAMVAAKRHRKWGNADEAVRKLSASPLSTCAFSFEWHGRPSEELLVVFHVVMCATLLCEKFPHLSLNSLIGISFVDDFERVAEVPYGECDSEVHYHSVTVTKALDVGGSKMLIVRGEVADGFLDDIEVYGEPDSGRFESSRYAIVYELCRIAEKASANQTTRPLPLATADVNAAPGSPVAAMAELLWRAFFASQLTASTQANAEVFQSCKAGLIALHSDMAGCTEQYLGHRESDDFFKAISSKLELAAEYVGRAAGAIDSWRPYSDNDHAYFYLDMKSLGLGEAWKKCFEALVKLSRSLPESCSTRDVDSLFAACTVLLNGFGLRLVWKHGRIEFRRSWRTTYSLNRVIR